jgi:aarF domain-containing kinase
MSLFDDISRSLELGKLGLELRTAAGSDSHERVVKRMASMRGLPQKIGQILNLHEIGEQSSEYSPLTEGTPTLCREESLAIIEKELGGTWEEHFLQISETAFGASLGQVHKGRLTNGKNVAIKVQYPKIERTVHADLQALGILSLPLVHRKKRGFDIGGYQAELRKSLLQEIDYEHERETLARFWKRTEDDPHTIVPAPFPELSTKRLLTMEWIEGAPLKEATSWSRGERYFLGRLLVRLFLKSWLIWREVHGDPHSGKLSISSLSRQCRDRRTGLRLYKTNIAARGRCHAWTPFLGTRGILSFSP